MTAPLRQGSTARAGRIGPRRRRGLRSRVVVLRTGGVMEWHSTRTREELLLVLMGRLQLEARASSGRMRTLTLTSGEYAVIPSQTWHRLRNRSRARARYLYVTALAK